MTVVTDKGFNSCSALLKRESLYEHLSVMLTLRVSPDENPPRPRGHRRREIERGSKGHKVNDDVS